MSDIELAIRRIEESKASHVAWAVHLRDCSHCKEHPPEHVHTAEEQDQIVAEYDVVLKVLRGAEKSRELLIQLVGVECGRLGLSCREVLERERWCIACDVHEEIGIPV